ncbi:MAG: SH3 domain-containing protein [Candidatus Omnitrophota bacterium]
MKSKIKNIALLLILILIFSVFINTRCFAGIDDIRGIIKSEEIFKDANSLYKENKYPQAAKEYEKALEKGYESGNLYYNLGNSYFKTGDFGRAMLNYERARLFIPHDSDLKSNYNYTKSLLNLGSESFPGGWIFRYVDKISEGININFLTICICALYVLICLFLILRMFFNGTIKFYKIIIYVLIVFFILGSVCLYRKIHYLNTSAVVVNKEAQVKFEPFGAATTFFTLERGSKIEVIEKSGDWYKLRRSDGKSGWVNKSAIEFISA